LLILDKVQDVASITLQNYTAVS